jgi:hypothetical protein
VSPPELRINLDMSKQDKPFISTPYLSFKVRTNGVFLTISTSIVSG